MKVKLLIAALGFLMLTSFSPKFERHQDSSNASCQVSLIDLECLAQEGSYFKDNVYFIVTINGKRSEVPGRFSMGTGSIVDMSGGKGFNLDDSIEFELWDDDTFDPDDFLGKGTIHCSQAGMGKRRIDFDARVGHGYITTGGTVCCEAHYVLTYIVR